MRPTSFCGPRQGWMPGLAPVLRAFLFSLLRALAGGCPAATHFLLLRQKKVSKEKATRSLGPLRFAAGQPAVLDYGGVSLNSLRSNNAIPDPPTSALLGPARTGQSGAGTGTNTNKDSPWRVLVSSGIRYWFSAVWYSFSPPLVDAPRSAGPDGSGIALSERSAAQRV